MSEDIDIFGSKLLRKQLLHCGLEESGIDFMLQYPQVVDSSTYHTKVRCVHLIFHRSKRKMVEKALEGIPGYEIVWLDRKTKKGYIPMHIVEIPLSFALVLFAATLIEQSSATISEYRAAVSL